jgi:hypothetical protein
LKLANEKEKIEHKNYKEENDGEMQEDGMNISDFQPL